MARIDKQYGDYEREEYFVISDRAGERLAVMLLMFQAGIDVLMFGKAKVKIVRGVLVYD